MYHSIQACRALAALLVVCFHLGGTLQKEKYLGQAAHPIERLFSSGEAGVPFFFVLSGFLITWIHQRDFGCPRRLPHYLAKRLLRIYPGYLVVFLAVYAVALAVPSLRDTVPHDAATLARSLLLLPQDKAVVGGTGAPVLIVAWTLQYEMVFYASIALTIVSRWFLALAAAAFAVNFYVCRLYGIDGFPQAFFANELIVLFGMGMAVAQALRHGMKPAQPLVLAAAGTAAFLALCAIETGIEKTGRYPAHILAYGAFSSVVIFGLVGAEQRFPGRFDNKFLALLGDASYALYLIHFPLVSIMCKAAVLMGLSGFGGAVLAFVGGAAACVAAGVVFHLLVERPLMRRLASSVLPRIVALRHR